MTNDYFGLEEKNLICIFANETRKALIKDLQLMLPYIYDSDLKKISENVVKKVEAMSDEDYSQLSFGIEYIKDEE